jgi:hypothetical protein
MIKFLFDPFLAILFSPKMKDEPAPAVAVLFYPKTKLSDDPLSMILLFPII